MRLFPLPPMLLDIVSDDAAEYEQQLNLQTPFEILANTDQADLNKLNVLNRRMGISTLAFTLEAAAYIGAIVVILIGFIYLLVCNYPKTVAETKRRVVHAIFVVMFIAMMPLLMDTVYNIFKWAFYGA